MCGSDVCFVPSDCDFYCLLTQLDFFLLKTRHNTSDNRNCGKQIFSVKFHVNLARSRALINVCCTYRWQRLQVPLVSLFLPFLLTVGFLKQSYSESASCCSFIQNLLFYWSPVNVPTRCEGGEAFCNLMMKYYDGLVSLGCDIYKNF